MGSLFITIRRLEVSLPSLGTTKRQTESSHIKMLGAGAPQFIFQWEELHRRNSVSKIQQFTLQLTVELSWDI